MGGYVLRRIAMFAPTLALIVLVVFGVVNRVPAVPPNATMEAANPASRETSRIFRAQYSLHLPVFVNLRHRLTSDDVRERLAASTQDGGVLVREELEDLRDDGIPELIDIAGDPSVDVDLRGAAIELLPALARQLISWRDDEATRLEMAAENEVVDRMRVDAPPTDLAEVERRASAWRAWLDEREARFEAPTGFALLGRVLTETRLATYLGRIARLDFGVSMIDRRPVLPTLLTRLRHSVALMLVAALFTYLVAIPLGALLARVRGSRGDRRVTVLLYALYSLPTFFVASLLLRYLTIGRPFDWFPIGGLWSEDHDELSFAGRLLDLAHHAVLPVLCLSLGGIAVVTRFTRASVLEVLGSEFVRTARAKGLKERAVLFRHALRNALLPLITLLGDLLPIVFGGSVIVEFLFDIPGLGSYAYESILLHDYNAIMAVTLISAVLTLIGYLLSDLLYAAADPRVKLAVGARR